MYRYKVVDWLYCVHKRCNIKRVYINYIRQHFQTSSSCFLDIHFVSDILRHANQTQADLKAIVDW